MLSIFGLRKTFKSAILDSWLQMTPELSDEEKLILRNFQELLILNGDAWQERELALNFIGPLVDGDVELGGEPDGIIATGYRTPKMPMFAFSEFKRELESKGDPIGQTLAAMLVGQVLNQRENPLYGCYVVGHDWHFMTLESKHYAISRDFSAVTDEIFEIFRVLKALKLIVIEMTIDS